MKQLGKLKLNRLSNAELNEMELSRILGGHCTCACAYVNCGGSSSSDNNSANTSGSPAGLHSTESGCGSGTSGSGATGSSGSTTGSSGSSYLDSFPVQPNNSNHDCGDVNCSYEPRKC